MIRIGFVLIGIGLVVLCHGYFEWTMSTRCTAEPEAFTLADLIDRGPDGNAHVSVSNFLFRENFVVQTSKYGSWKTVWIPVAPNDEVDEPPGRQMESVRAIVKCTTVRDNRGLAALEARRAFRGLVINKVDSLDSTEQQLLSRHYPGTEFSRCLLIEEGRGPAATRELIGFIGGGALLTLVGSSLVIIPTNRERRRKIERQKARLASESGSQEPWW